MKTLILHVGTQKTATTTIQKFMADNVDILRVKGYAYPIFDFRYPYKSVKRNGMFLGIKVFDKDNKRDIAEEKRRYELAMDTIHDLFRTHDNVVLSDESLWWTLSSREGRIRELAEDALMSGYEIKTIIYLRRQDEFIESMWNQQVKTKEYFHMTLNEYIENSRFSKYLDYIQPLKTFAELAGEDNLIVRRFSDAVRSEGGIIADFMRNIGLELTDEYMVREENANKGLAGNEIRIMQLVNEIEGMTREEHKLFRESLVMCSPNARQSYPCSEFSDEERGKFLKNFEEGNRIIAERFLRDGCPAFSRDYSGLPKREDRNQAMTDDIIRSMASIDLTLYRHLIQLKTDLELRIDEMEKQADALERKIASHERRINNLRHPLRALSVRRNKKK